MILNRRDFYVDLNKLPVMSTDFYKNLVALDNFYYNNLLSYVSKPVNRFALSLNNDIFSFNVNAYYDPISNILFIPTSMLNDVFVSEDKEMIINYGSLGAIIGHEIMHCFDNYGAMFDHNGHLKNWWSVKDYEYFNTELEKVKHHYSNLSVNRIRLDGELSVGENIADILGLKLSLKTYISNYIPNYIPNYIESGQNSQNTNKHLEKFFESWSNTLRSIDSNENLENSIKFEVHPPGIIRINAPFSHIKEYYDVYNVQKSHLNFLDPTFRTSIFD